MPESTPEDLKTILKSLKHFPIKDLEEVRAKVDETIEKKKDRERKVAIKKAREIIEENEIAREELYPETSSPDSSSEPRPSPLNEPAQSY